LQASAHDLFWFRVDSDHNNNNTYTEIAHSLLVSCDIPHIMCVFRLYARGYRLQKAIK